MRFHSITALVLIAVGGVGLLWSHDPAASSGQVVWRQLGSILFALTGVVVASIGVAGGKIIAEIRESRK